MKMQRHADYTIGTWQISSQKPQNALRYGLSRTSFGTDGSSTIRALELTAAMFRKSSILNLVYISLIVILIQTPLNKSKQFKKTTY